MPECLDKLICCKEKTGISGALRLILSYRGAYAWTRVITALVLVPIVVFGFSRWPLVFGRSDGSCWYCGWEFCSNDEVGGLVPRHFIPALILLLLLEQFTVRPEFRVYSQL